MTTALASSKAYGVCFKDLDRWDIKAAMAVRFGQEHSTFRPLQEFAEEATELIRPWETPLEDWPVYGVNNEVGVFFSHFQKGSTFNAPYKRIRKDWFFHNPTRANVGSLGRVPEVPDDAITSPEYQVWRLRDGITPDFMEVLLRMDFFRKQVEFQRVGAVKERLFTQNLLQIRIPVLGVYSQEVIVAHWRAAQEAIAAARGRMEKRKASIDARFFADIGLRSPAQGSMPKAFGVLWKEVERWGAQFIYLNCQRRPEPKFREVLLSEACKIGSGGTPQRGIKGYFGGSIPWVKTAEVRNEEITSTEESLTTEGLLNSSARVYPKGSLLIAMYGQGATRGRTAKLAIDAATNQACAVLYDIDPRIETDFLWYFLMSQYEAIRVLASGNNQPNLNAEMIANLRIPLPPRAMQQQIMDRVAAGREEIARERETADRLAHDIKAEIEAMILGTKDVGEGSPKDGPGVASGDRS